MFKHSQTKEEKINILNQILELFKASIFRQTMFAEFEKNIFEANEQGEIITADYLNIEYYKLVQKYYGKNIIIDEDIKYEWERIPHFYYDFYVYKYSTGLAAAAYIVKNIFFASLYNECIYKLMNLDYYIESVGYILTHIFALCQVL